MRNLWYPITAHHPSPLVQVRGIVEVRCSNPFDAQLIISRGKPPHINTWAEWAKGKARPLTQGIIPKYWQPQHPEHWKAPLPPPANVPDVSRMWSATQRFQAVEEAEAAELAREMERDREMARGGAIYERPEKEKLPWWRDVTLIRYEPVGAITPRMAEGRVMRAVALCGHGQGLTIKSNSFSKILADISAANVGEKYATADYVPRLQALPSDNDDFLNAMAWFVALNPIEMRSKKQQRFATWDFNRAQMLLIWRSFDIPLSFEIIGSRYGMTGEGARQAYKNVMSKCVRVANGLPAYAHLPQPCSHIEDLRERNRKAKREAAA